MQTANGHPQQQQLQQQQQQQQHQVSQQQNAAPAGTAALNTLMDRPSTHQPMHDMRYSPKIQSKLYMQSRPVYSHGHNNVTNNLGSQAMTLPGSDARMYHYHELPNMRSYPIAPSNPCCQSAVDYPYHHCIPPHYAVQCACTMPHLAPLPPVSEKQRQPVCIDSHSAPGKMAPELAAVKLRVPALNDVPKSDCCSSSGPDNRVHKSPKSNPSSPWTASTAAAVATPIAPRKSPSPPSSTNSARCQKPYNSVMSPYHHPYCYPHPHPEMIYSSMHLHGGPMPSSSYFFNGICNNEECTCDRGRGPTQPLHAPTWSAINPTPPASPKIVHAGGPNVTAMRKRAGVASSPLSSARYPPQGFPPHSYPYPSYTQQFSPYEIDLHPDGPYFTRAAPIRQHVSAHPFSQLRPSSHAGGTGINKGGVDERLNPAVASGTNLGGRLNASTRARSMAYGPDYFSPYHVPARALEALERKRAAMMVNEREMATREAAVQLTNERVAVSQENQRNHQQHTQDSPAHDIEPSAIPPREVDTSDETSSGSSCSSGSPIASNSGESCVVEARYHPNPVSTCVDLLLEAAEVSKARTTTI
ncbi:hypothetical protein HDU76_007947 [Blyttiomyces sp. JEL0837]|nr:hypothetical protein HDU76_007947 [Blyttiomyces sp. JEL0837]